MKRIELRDTDPTVRELVELGESEPVILTRNGTAVAGVLEVDDADVQAWSLGSNPEFLEIIERSRERGKREGAVPLDEVRRPLGIAGAGAPTGPGDG